MTKQEMAAELLRRRRARDSLHSFALSVDIPTAPMGAMQPDETLFGPAEFLMEKHHAVICTTLQRTVTRPYGRCLIMAPPGSAKSAYASVVMPPWVMGRTPGSRIILTSYASTPAERQSRRAQQICRSQLYRDLWPEPVEMVREAVNDWGLTNNSELIAMGLTAGLTSNRTSGWIVDDPVPGRDQADSATERQNTLDAYQDDLLTRCLPGAWGVVIMTRWHELDLGGQILPENYDGRSGMVRCRDGLDWEVLNLQAKCERADDPLGRQLGEYMWPSWWGAQHWAMVENNPSREAQRSWASLYQQRPSPQGSGVIDRAWFKWYDPGDEPPVLRKCGASDFAVTEGGGDFTEHAVWGMDANGELWLLDGWSGQKDPAVTIKAVIDMARRHAVNMWLDEKGVIHNAIKSAWNRAMREQQWPMNVISLVSNADKVAKVQSFAARASSGMVHLPRSGPCAAWAEDMVTQLVSLPAGRYDDKADVAGLIGRAVDQIANARIPEPAGPRGIVAFSPEWLEYVERPTQTVRVT